MANNTYPTKNVLLCNCGTRIRYRHNFYEIFDLKKIRDGVTVLSTREYCDCFNEECDFYFTINPIKGRKLDKDNKIVCDGDVNVVNIFNSHCKVELGWMPRCIVTVLVPIGKNFGYNQDILEFNCNEDEINDYLREQQLEKYKEEIKTAELKKSLRQVARQELIEEGILFDEEHKRPYIPREVIGLVYMRDNGRCRECGATKDLQLDHIIPFSKGGSSEPENLQLLCRDCNLKHGNKF